MRRFYGSAGLVAVALLTVALALAPEESLDLAVLTQIRDEGYNRSQVMETAGYLCDVIGPRLTGSPAYKKAHEWTRERLEKWGLKNSRLESWDFGQGWSVERVSVHMTEPTAAPLVAMPLGWSPGTEGPVRGKVIKARLESEQDLAAYKGKVGGMILLTADAPDLKVHEEPEFRRYSEEQLQELSQFRPVGRRRGDPDDYARRRRFARAFNQFLAEQKPLAVIAPAGADGGTIRLIRSGQKAGEAIPFPYLIMAAEHYARIVRLLDRDIPVELELDIRVKFSVERQEGYNTLAEIPGTDLSDQVVMLGAHLDSWHLGTGATDNAAGVSVVMEAARILNALRVKPRRTIKVALWGGEEQGFLGSRAYVSKYLAARPEPAGSEEDREGVRSEPGDLQIKPDYSKFSAYFNLDNGTGRIRGIYLQGNAALRPVFEAWLKPIHDLGATTVTMRSTSGTDHVPFDSVGLPGFQFIQDEVEYFSRTWHTNMDVYDRLQREDLMQASVVMAWFAYNAAMRDELLPRKPMPETKPAS